LNPCSWSKAQCTGEVRLLGAQISGQLACDEATFTHPDGNALGADGMTVDGAMFFAGRNAPARLRGAHIKKELLCGAGGLH
jgi:hypothetical protein